LTGQHPNLDPDAFGLVGLKIYRLGCPGEEDPHRHVQAVASALLRSLRFGLDVLVVQGDTSSALGAALAGFTAGLPVAHVEAGLRTHDPQFPWPEEEYRTAIDAQADLLFAPTPTAAANLRAEKVPGEIHVTGNTGIDAVLAAEAKLPTRLPKRGRRILVTCHRRESWDEGLESIAAALVPLASRDVQVDLILHPNPWVAARMRTLLEAVPNVTLLEPCSQEELLQHMRSSDLVLSDSGGIQEEAPALGVPLLVLREKTERPEGVAIGNAILVGTSTKRIVDETQRLLDDRAALAAMSRRSFPYGDGKAAPRIAAVIERWLARHHSVARDETSTPARL
jgi:UDP-N-acetylglucosamine 2-epimerase (non-hydrolysing)